MRRALGAALFLALGCTSTSSTHAEPELQLIQLSTVAEAARNVTGGIPVQYRLTIHNTTMTPLQLKRIDLVSQGDGAYNLQPMSQAYDQVIDVGATLAFEMWGQANVQYSTISGANGPVTIRAIAQFDSAAGRFQTVVVQQVHPNGSV